ncbi:uncharacterized protein J4E88_005235 [Alternaria novae-zelandiae]|uniref:uncharacterized protein n=1 Tax=Alternaria novae-zelandiae TaxID=430562 RepID=UPI0020C20A98|nr:uncharacterized protein J4E88_005235 [Alternaria novae-zelandiae]KAI4682345.1 hypothetical protein J4E88_005235 [Alternaria novae-zelandiae]
MLRPTLLSAIRLNAFPSTSKRAFSLLNPSSRSHTNRIFDPIRQPNDLHTLTLLNASDNRSLITFWTATWCQTCQAIKPLIRQLIEEEKIGEREGGLGFVEVLMDSTLIEDLPIKYRISSMPTLLAFSRQEAQFDTRLTRPEEMRNKDFLREWLVREAQRGGRMGGGGGNQDYEAAVVKGTRLLQILAAKDKTQVQSAYEEVQELAQHGHLLKPQDKFFEINCIADALCDLGVSDKMVYDGGENNRTHHVHDRDGAEATEDDTTTHGYFSQVSNPHSGVLIADSNLSPAHAAKFDDEWEEEAIELPSLRHWSDVAFLQYLSSFPEPPIRPIPLNYVFRVQIQNAATSLVLNKIISKHATFTYEMWPGITFGMDSEEGKAILGTPNGCGVAWMLIQHKKAFGEKNIEKVTLFHAAKKDDLFRWPTLLFWIV